MPVLLATTGFAQGIITTVAGRDWLFPDHGRPAVEAQLAGPSGMAFDPQGNAYIADPALNTIFKVNREGIITVAAGLGLPRYAGDGGPARAANLANPTGVALDASGNLFIADTFNHRIRKVSPSGIITTVAGTGWAGFGGDGGPATAALLRGPSSVALDSRGNLYIGDRGNNRVRRVDPAGIITTVAGNGENQSGGDGGPAPRAAIGFPTSVALDSAGVLYLTDEVIGNRIRRVGPDGIITTIAGGGNSTQDGVAATSFRLARPSGVFVDASGVLYIADQFAHRVRRVDRSGVLTTVAGNGQSDFSGDGGPALAAALSRPYAVAIGPDGDLYIADRDNHRVRRVRSGGIRTLAGRGAFHGDDGPSVEARISNPSGMALDSAGNLYIADFNSQRIRRVTPRGVISTVAGSGRAGYSPDGVLATRASLDGPSSVAVDAQDNVYFTDNSNNVVRRVTAAATLATVAGSRRCCEAPEGVAATLAWITFPQYLVADRSGNLYFHDFDANRVRRVSAPGIFSTAAGSGQTGYSGDSGPAGRAALSNNVSALAVDNSGNLYIGDSGNYRVRRVDRSGILTTFAGNGEAGFSGDGGPAAAARIGFVGGLAADEDGNLYLATNNRIRRVDRAGIITTYAGSGRAEFSGDGGPARRAGFSNPRSLVVGRSGTLLVSDAFNTRIRRIEAGAGPSLALSQRGLTFAAIAGSPPPPAQSFAVVNSGQGTMQWSLRASTVSGGPWLSVSATGGDSTAGVPPPAVDAGVNPAGLGSGVYYGRIEITAVGAPNSPQTLTVVLTVFPEGTSLAPALRPSGLLFVSEPGRDPAPQPLILTSLARQPVSFTATPAAFGQGPRWFSVTPATGTLTPGQPARLEVRASSGSLPAAIYTGRLVIAAGGDTLPAELALVVAPGASVVVQGTACTPTRLAPLITSLGAGFTATAGWPTPLEARIANDCGQPLEQGTVVASFSNNDPPMALAPLREGRWSGTWQPRHPAAAVTISLRAESGSPRLAGAVEVSGGLGVNPTPPPEIGSGAVLHAASFRLGAPLSPGAMVSIFGSRLSEGTQAATELPLPLPLAGATAVIAGRPLPLIFASPNQINAMLPYDLPVEAIHQLLVRRGNTLSVPEPVSIVSTQAGVFTRDQTGRGEGIVVVVHRDGSQGLVGPDNPAGPGDVLVIYSAGLGEVDPRAIAGAQTPVDPLSSTVQAVSATISGLAAPVLFAGLTPGFTGLYQVNVAVPEGVPSSREAPLVLMQGEQSSPPVTIAVR